MPLLETNSFMTACQRIRHHPSYIACSPIVAKTGNDKRAIPL